MRTFDNILLIVLGIYMLSAVFILPAILDPEFFIKRMVIPSVIGAIVYFAGWALWSLIKWLRR